MNTWIYFLAIFVGSIFHNQAYSADYLSRLVRVNSKQEVIYEKEQQDRHQHLIYLCKRQLNRQKFPTFCFELRFFLKSYPVQAAWSDIVLPDRVLNMDCDLEIQKQKGEISLLGLQKWVSERCFIKIQKHNQLVRYRLD